MDAKSQQPKRKDVPSSLNAAIDAMNIAKRVSTVIPTTVVYGSVGTLLSMIRVLFLLFSDDKP